MDKGEGVIIFLISGHFFIIIYFKFIYKLTFFPARTSFHKVFFPSVVSASLLRSTRLSFLLFHSFSSNFVLKTVSVTFRVTARFT